MSPLCYILIFCVATAIANVDKETVLVVWRESKVKVIDGRALLYLIVRFDNPCDKFLNVNAADEVISITKCKSAYFNQVVKPMRSICRKQPEIHPFNYNFLTKQHSLFDGHVGFGNDWNKNNELYSVRMNITDETTLQNAIERIENNNLTTVDASFIKKSADEMQEMDIRKRHFFFNDLLDSINKFKDYIENESRRKFQVTQKFSKDFYKLVYPGNDKEDFFKRFDFDETVDTACAVNSEHANVLHFFISVPLVSESVKLVEADPFKFIVTKGIKSCEVNYVGPKYFFVNKETYKIYSVYNQSVSSTATIQSPPDHHLSKKKESGDESLFQIGSCFPTANISNFQYLQVKKFGNFISIYCPNADTSVDRSYDKCSELPYTTKIYANLDFRSFPYIPGLWESNDENSSAPLYTDLVNLNIKPELNLAKFEAEIGVKVFIQKVDDMEKYAYLVLALLFCFFSWFICIRRAKLFCC